MTTGAMYGRNSFEIELAHNKPHVFKVWVKINTPETVTTIKKMDTSNWILLPQTMVDTMI